MRTADVRIRDGLLAGTAASLILLSTVPAQATQGIIYVTTSKVLVGNHYGTVILNSNNASINCSGYSIYYHSSGYDDCGASGGQTCGILVSSGKTGTTVSNCHVHNFDLGIYGNDVDRLKVTNSSTSFNTIGMLLQNTQGYYLRAWANNEWSYNDEEGLDIDNCSSIYVNGSRFYYNGRDGADIGGGSGFSFYEDDFWNNVRNGLELDGAAHAYVSYSVFESNGLGTDRNGLSLDNSDYFDITGNRALSNGKDGIRVMNGSNYGGATYNTGRDNDAYDARQEGCVGNTWSNNDFGKTSGI